jgi:hypothetical protein
MSAKKGGRRGLTRGKPRLLGKHDGWQGREYARGYADLEAELGAFTGLRRFEAGRVAAARVNLVAAQRALAEARRTHERGRGRRPGARELEKLARRVGLADGTYSQALDRLRELVGPRTTPSLRDLVAAQREPRG